MNPRRHGRRDPTRALILTLAACAGCGSGSVPKTMAVSNPTARLPIVLDGPPGGSAVSEIAWGGMLAPKVVAVRRADGRFSVHRPGVTRDRIDSLGEGASARSIAVVGIDRVATGDASGVTLWDASRSPARPIGHRDCGDVSSLIALEAEGRELALIAGCADGRIVRMRIARDDRIEITATAKPNGAAVGIVRLQALSGRSDFLAIAVDGSARSLRPDLAGEPKALGQARMFASGQGTALRAKLLDGPRVEIAVPGDTVTRGRFLPSRPVNSLALVGGGSILALGADRSLWIAPLEKDGRILPSRVRVVDGLAGAVVVAAEPGGTRVAVGDGVGRVELIDAASLLAKGQPMSLDDAPEWAFRPASRLDRPRSGDRDARIETARRRLDRGDDAGGDLRTLEADETLERGSLAEVKALVASAESRSGGSAASVRRKLAEAAALFAKAGLADREADMEFWLGTILLRPLDPSPGGHDPRTMPEAIGSLRRAAALYRNAKVSPGLDRQAHLCDAARAWALLDLGDVSGASAAFAPVAEAARADSVLGRVVEIERIAAAIAAARRDWPRSAASDARVLMRLAHDEREGLAREAALSRAGALAAIGDWPAAAETLSGDRPADAEWTIRRAVCRQNAGLGTDRRPSATEDDPIAAHLRAVAIPSDPTAQLADLTLAARGHRLAGRDDLALEAELARAECLERIGKNVEAASAHAAVARGIASLGSDPSRTASRPILDQGRRAARGLARCELAAGQPLRALAALEAAASPGWSSEPGAALGLAAAEFPLAEALRDARSRLESLGGPGASAEADSAALDVHRAQSSLAGQARAPRPGDPSSALGSTALGLADDEAIVAFTPIGPQTLLAVFIRGNGEPEARVLAIQPANLAHEVAAWRAAIGEGGRPIAPENATTAASILGLAPEPDPPTAKSSDSRGGPIEGRLHDALIGPFAAKLDGLGRLYVVPGAGLAAMPLEALGRGGRLGEKVSLRSLPRASVLPLARDDAKPERPSEHTALLISPSGGAAARAWAATAQASGWTAKTLLGEEARPDRVLGDPLAGYRVIHIASEAVLDPARAASAGSMISLQPGRWPAFADGRLASRDLAHVPLRARVLALEVHDPKGVTAHGLLDLANAGLSTGAEGVLITLWKHPESSSQVFFAAYYEALAADRSPAEAASAARSAVARDPRFRDPVHWAGYAHYGP